jgi:hypothetical protein
MRAPTADQVLADLALDLLVAAFRSHLAEIEVSPSMAQPTALPTARVRTWSSRRSRDGQRLQGVVYASMWSHPDDVLRFERALFVEGNGEPHEHVRDLPRGRLIAVQLAGLHWPSDVLTTAQLRLTVEPTR